MSTTIIILASTSPRRRELIQLFGLDCRFTSADVDESPQPGESPENLVRRLSIAKAEMGARGFADSIVIGCDTIVSIDDTILGKPTDSADAVRMLKLLRQRVHTVFSGLTVLQGDKQITQIITTPVRMRNYSDDEITTYVATGDPLDKAASYAIQHNHFRPVERIEGCHANVMGLPLCHLYLALENFGAPVNEPDLACQNHLSISCSVARNILNPVNSEQ